MKSPVITATTRPLVEIESEWRDEDSGLLIDYANEKEQYELRVSAWKEQFNKAQKKQLHPRPPAPMANPTRRREGDSSSTAPRLKRSTRPCPRTPPGCWSSATN